MEQNLLKPEEVAEILNISKYTVYEMVKRGDLTAIRIGRKMRFDPEVINRFTSRVSSEQQTITTSTVEVDRNPYTAAMDLSQTKPILFLGSHDNAVEELASLMSAADASIHFFTAFIGSMDGLMNLYFGKADIAGCHLFDEETGNYNTPFVKRIFPGEPIHIVHFVERNIGWIIPKGNPKNITTWTDLARTDVKIVNRQKGSGTRILLDYQLRRQKLEASHINGYEEIEKTHFNAASRVARGLADFALGTESAARALGLDFVLLTKENYDFVMKPAFLQSTQGQAFMRVLQSPKLKEKIASLGGYNINNLGIFAKEEKGE